MSLQPAAVLCCWDGQVECQPGGHLSGPANVSGLPQPLRCAGVRWRNGGRRCWSQHCLTRSCWPQPEAYRSVHFKNLMWILGSYSPRHISAFVFLTSAHLWMVSGPTPPSTSMSSEGNWLLNQLTWECGAITDGAWNLHKTISATRFSSVSRTAKKDTAVNQIKSLPLDQIWILVRQKYCALVNKFFYLGWEPM